jgi:predicted HicB family RNase H-like nuclease
MMTTTGDEAMAKKRKKSEVRKHTAMMRVDADTLEQARLAASLMKMSLADYASVVLRKAAAKDISREARKLTGENRE